MNSTICETLNIVYNMNNLSVVPKFWIDNPIRAELDIYVLERVNRIPIELKTNWELSVIGYS